MARIEDYVLPVKQMTREEFTRLHETPFLLWCRPADDQGNQAWSFKTQTVPQDRAVLARILSEQGLRLSPEVVGYEVYPVKKTQANPWRDRISIGRARNNDIVLMDSSISKLHTHLTLGANNALSITDAGSRNGTQVGDKVLGPQETLPLQNGTPLLLGRLEMLFLSPEGLYDFIAKHIIAMP